ncbi:Hsp20/alpha crystallin family protein [Hippea alviniae]|uniref:Hsp20/alpha crystallin family protein n=1 Tax=Hippea alviniae TaxID=1279027 RepID=UPI0003B5BE35|nr:Hsp20/alpha crystallin family protein [Hippea alviniae]
MLNALEPFRELTTLQERLNKVFDDLLPNALKSRETSEWIPAVDIYETKDAINIEVEAPGMKQEDIKINLENNTLTIYGERKFEKKEEGKNYYRMERSYGSFSRSFLLPDNVNVEGIKAKYKDGVLTITLPKKPESKPKEIPIESEEK